MPNHIAWSLIVALYSCQMYLTFCYQCILSLLSSYHRLYNWTMFIGSVVFLFCYNDMNLIVRVTVFATILTCRQKCRKIRIQWELLCTYILSFIFPVWENHKNNDNNSCHVKAEMAINLSVGHNDIAKEEV